MRCCVLLEPPQYCFCYVYKKADKADEVETPEKVNKAELAVKLDEAHRSDANKAKADKADEAIKAIVINKAIGSKETNWRKANVIDKIVVSDKAIADNADTSVANEAHATDKAVAPEVAIESNVEAKVVKPDKANEADVTEFDRTDKAIKVNATNEAIATDEAAVD